MQLLRRNGARRGSSCFFGESLAGELKLRALEEDAGKVKPSMERRK